jgi:hypothetical protein
LRVANRPHELAAIRLDNPPVRQIIRIGADESLFQSNLLGLDKPEAQNLAPVALSAFAGVN